MNSDEWLLSINSSLWSYSRAYVWSFYISDVGWENGG